MFTRRFAAVVGRMRLPAVGLALLALGLGAPPAFATGTVTVTIAGTGKVTGSGGIDCSGVSGTTSGVCTATIPSECETDPKPQCFPGEAVLTAADVNGSGFTFDHWSGDCSGTTTSCDLTVEGGMTAEAVFRDSQAPSVTLTQPAGGPRAGTIGLAASAADNAGVSRVDFSVRGVLRASDVSAPYSASFDSRTISDGAATVVATAYDTSGNATASAPVNLVIDNTAPSLAVSGPSGQTFNASATESWTMSVSDATSGVASVQCSVVPAGRSAAFGACSGGASGESVSGLPEGAYTFTARAIDAAGNTRDVSRSFSVDTTPPETTITSGVADGTTTTDTSLSWSFASSEAGSTFRCRVYPAALTPGAFAPCSGVDSHTASGFSPGTYTFEVVATDAVGNTDPTPASRTFTVAAPSAGGGGTSGAGGGSAAGGGGGAASGGGSGAGSGGGTVLGGSVPQLLVTLAFNYRSRAGRTRLTRLVIRHVPSGSTVTATCPRDCRHASFRKRHAHGTVSLGRLIGRWMKANTRITVTVTTPRAGSATKVLTIRRSGSPRVTSRCRPPGASRAAAC